MKCLKDYKHFTKSICKFTKNLPIFHAIWNKPSFPPQLRRPGGRLASGREVVEDDLGEVADFDRGLAAEGGEAEGAGGHYGLRRIDREVGDRRLGYLVAVSGIQGEAAETASAAEAFLTLMAGRNKVGNQAEDFAWFRIDTHAAAEFARIVVDIFRASVAESESPGVDEFLDVLGIVEDSHAFERVLFGEDLVADRAGENQRSAAAFLYHFLVGLDDFGGGIRLAGEEKRAAAADSAVAVSEDVVCPGGLEEPFDRLDDAWGEVAHAAGEVHDLFGGRGGSRGRSGSGGAREGSGCRGGGTGEVGVVVWEEVVDSAALGAT